jgi:hypothetical protein
MKRITITDALRVAESSAFWVCGWGRGEGFSEGGG